MQGQLLKNSLHVKGKFQDPVTGVDDQTSADFDCQHCLFESLHRMTLQNEMNDLKVTFFLFFTRLRKTDLTSFCI